MARSLGRPLTKGETVHHINGDRADGLRICSSGRASTARALPTSVTPAVPTTFDPPT